MRKSGLEALCDSIQDSVFLLDEGRTIIKTNQRLEEVTGRSADSLVGSDVATLEPYVGGETFEAFDDAIDDVLSGRCDERRIEAQATSPTEGETVVDARITRFDSGEGDAGVVVVLRDIADLKGRERALAKRSEQLAIINRVLRHDIRNDVAVMLGWAEQLDRYVDSDEGREAVDRIVEHGRYVVELTKEARDLVDAVETDWEMPLEPVDAGRILRREVETVREQYPSAHVSLPDDPPPVTVMANEFLGSVYGNLLRNAIVHNDTAHPEVTVTCERTDESVSVRITDDGPGIPDDQRSTLFEKGAKGLDSPGSGMGLYLVRSLVNAYGGSVTVSDAHPRGTVVDVTLPA